MDLPLQSVIKILFCTYVWLMWEHLLGISWGPRLSWPVTWGHTSVCGWRSQWGRYHADTGCCWWHNLKRDNGSTDTQHVTVYDSAVKSRKSWVAQQTNHGGSLGGPCHLWVVRIYDVVRNDNETAMSLCVIYFQPVPKRNMIDDIHSLITLKFDRQLGSNTAKSPIIFQSKRL